MPQTHPHIPLPQLVERCRDTLKTLLSGQTKGEKPHFHGRGVVTCGGGHKYFPSAWILIKMLRYLGCELPVQVWHFGATEIDAQMKRIFTGLDVECIDATPYAINGPSRGRMLKAVAIARSRFKDVLFMDADNIPVKDPSCLFELPEYKKTGTLFWSDTSYTSEESPLWEIFRLNYSDEPEAETGQMVVNKDSSWESLFLAEQLILRSDAFHPLAPGGRGLFHMAWRKLHQPYAMPEFPPQMLSVPDVSGETKDAMLCQHDFSGERLFQHRLFCKWDLLGENPWISGAFFESKCHELLLELRGRWSGRVHPRKSSFKSAKLSTCEKSLLGNTWILTTPESFLYSSNDRAGSGHTSADVIGGDFLPAFVKAPREAAQTGNKIQSMLPRPKLQGKWYSTEIQELEFTSRGTVKIKKGADVQTGYFWDFGDSKRPQLFLSSKSGRVLCLKWQTESCWKGEDGASLRQIQDVYPHLATEPKQKMTASIRRKVIQSVGRQVHVSCSADGIGDDMVAAYVCAGLSRLGAEVVFHTSHAAWFSRVAEPGLTFTTRKCKSSVDLHYDYASQLRYGLSRASWYSAALHPLLKAAKPMMKLTGVKRCFPFNKYIIASPYTSFRDQWQDRHWPDAHWIRLANLLRKKGYEFVAIGMSGHSAALLRTFSQTQAYWVVGQSPEWVMDAMLGAEAYVGTDNGMTHLAALLGVKSVAIHSQLPASFLWPDSKIQSVTPNTECTFCRWQEDRGFLHSCTSNCSALATVNPEKVLSVILKQLGNS